MKTFNLKLAAHHVAYTLIVKSNGFGDQIITIEYENLAGARFTVFAETNHEGSHREIDDSFIERMKALVELDDKNVQAKHGVCVATKDNNPFNDDIEDEQPYFDVKAEVEAGDAYLAEHEHLNKQKTILKEFRLTLNSSYTLDDEYSEFLIDSIDTLIGRINCSLTDDDSELERLAEIDGLRGDV